MRQRDTALFIVNCLLILSVIAILGSSLFIGNSVGLSDNGDFNRVITPNRIYYEDGAREPFVFTDRFKLAFEGDGRFEKIFNTLFTLDGRYITTQHLFIKISILLNLCFNAVSGTDFSVYHIEWLGAAYCLFLVVAVSLFIFTVRTGKTWLDIIFKLLFIFFFCDIAYTAYFNSFYGEALQFVSFLFIFACMAAVIFSKKHGKLFCLLYFSGVILFMGSKFANIPIGLLFALAGLAFLGFRDGGRGFKAVTAGGLIVSLAAAALFYIAVPNWMDKATTYQAVFFGILKDSPDPEKDLEQLDLPLYMADLQNTNYYMDGHKVDISSDDFQRDFYRKVSKADVLKFYLRNPARFLDKLDISCKNSSLIRPKYLGNLGPGNERLTLVNEFGLWSGIRAKMPFDSLLFTFALFLVSLVIIITELRSAFRAKPKDPKKIAVCAYYTALLGGTAINLAVPVVANGEADIAKHMFGFINGMDLIFFSVMFWIFYKLAAICRSCIGRIADPVKIIASRNRTVPVLVSVLAVIAVIAAAAAFFAGYGKTPGSSKKGAFVTIGRLDGTPLLWRILDEDESGILLLADAPVAYMPFDTPSGDGDANRQKYGSNLWRDSSLREWLNGDFTAKCFSESEQELIQDYKNKVILSRHDLDMAVSGSNDFFWTHVPTMVDFGYDEAYSDLVADRIFLLDVRQFREYLAEGNIAYARKYPWWLETPYFQNSSMVRVVDTDGYVYMKDALVDHIAVLPAMYIKPEVSVSDGDGSREDPFIFELKR